MYLVNTTFAVEYDVHDRWFELVRGKYVPLLEENGYNIVALSRVISAEATGHFTYSLLVGADDIPAYQRLTDELFGEYLAVAGPLFGDRVVWFTSLMKKL
ncbi:DUF4286 family protein [Alistipes sp. OttesenSCG-928-B03]|nr:DUF4286 family protein [Alistipes sp. OttesenSCG-928-B03]